jgi:hypothetical protein
MNMAQTIVRIEEKTGLRFGPFRDFDYGQTFYRLEVGEKRGNRVVVSIYHKDNGQVEKSLLLYPKEGGIKQLYPSMERPMAFFEEMVIEAVMGLSHRK